MSFHNRSRGAFRKRGGHRGNQPPPPSREVSRRRIFYNSNQYDGGYGMDDGYEDYRDDNDYHENFQEVQQYGYEDDRGDMQEYHYAPRNRRDGEIIIQRQVSRVELIQTSSDPFYGINSGNRRFSMDPAFGSILEQTRITKNFYSKSYRINHGMEEEDFGEEHSMRMNRFQHPRQREDDCIVIYRNDDDRRIQESRRRDSFNREDRYVQNWLENSDPDYGVREYEEEKRRRDQQRISSYQHPSMEEREIEVIEEQPQYGYSRRMSERSGDYSTDCEILEHNQQSKEDNRSRNSNYNRASSSGGSYNRSPSPPIVGSRYSNADSSDERSKRSNQRYGYTDRRDHESTSPPIIRSRNSNGYCLDKKSKESSLPHESLKQYGYVDRRRNHESSSPPIARSRNTSNDSSSHRRHDILKQYGYVDRNPQPSSPYVRSFPSKSRSNTPEQQYSYVHSRQSSIGRSPHRSPSPPIVGSQRSNESPPPPPPLPSAPPVYRGRTTGKTIVPHMEFSDEEMRLEESTVSRKRIHPPGHNQQGVRRPRENDEEEEEDTPAKRRPLSSDEEIRLESYLPTRDSIFLTQEEYLQKHKEELCNQLHPISPKCYKLFSSEIWPEKSVRIQFKCDVKKMELLPNQREYFYMALKSTNPSNIEEGRKLINDLIIERMQDHIDFNEKGHDVSFAMYLSPMDKRALGLPRAQEEIRRRGRSQNVTISFFTPSYPKDRNPPILITGNPRNIRHYKNLLDRDIQEYMEKQKTVSINMPSHAIEFFFEKKVSGSIYLENRTFAKINPLKEEGKVEITGDEKAIDVACSTVRWLRQIGMDLPDPQDTYTYHLHVEEKYIGKLLGHRGANIHRLRDQSGARIFFDRDTNDLLISGDFESAQKGHFLCSKSLGILREDEEFGYYYATNHSPLDPHKSKRNVQECRGNTL